jgi:predicted ester cyclase
MQWENSNGLVHTYQDAIKLEVEHNTAKHHIPSYGTMVLGQKLDAPNLAFQGSLAGLNFWTYLLYIDTIQGMAAGIINVNGDLLQWRDFMTDHVFGNVSIVERSEAEIPGILTISYSKEPGST